MSSQKEGQEIFCTLAVVYCVLCILCLFVIFYRRVLVDHPKSSGFFITSITILALLRSTFFLLISNIFSCVPLSVVYLFMTLPAFLQFFTYMSLISIWGEIYISLYHRGLEMRSLLHKSQEQMEQSMKRLHTILLAISSIIGIILLGLYTTLFALEGVSNCTTQLDSLYYDIYIAFASAMYLIAIPILTTFWMFGYKNYKKITSLDVVDKPEYQRKVLLRIGLLTLFCVVCFLARAAIMISEMLGHVITNSVIPLSLYYIFLELIPLLTMVYLLITTIIKPNTTWQSLN